MIIKRTPKKTSTNELQTYFVQEPIKMVLNPMVSYHQVYIANLNKQIYTWIIKMLASIGYYCSHNNQEMKTEKQNKHV